jgi:hypothetical protein
MKHPYQILLIPLTIWSGMEQGFFGAEYTTVSSQYYNEITMKMHIRSLFVRQHNTLLD